MRAILTYHSIDDSDSPISVPERVFRRHVGWLAAHGPRVVTLDELLALPPSEPAIALTFDDAFVNFADVAWPLLRDHGLPATLYVPTAHVGGTNTWGGRAQPGIPTLPIMDWDTLGRLAAEGVTLGSHTCTHPDLAHVSGVEVRVELERSAAELRQRLGIRPSGLAYPYGGHDESVRAIAAALYDHACTTDMRVLGSVEDRHGLPRIDMFYLRSANLLEAWGSTRLRLYLNARAGVRRWRRLLTPLSPA